MFSFPTFLKLSKSILIRDSHEQRASHPEARARLSELQAMYAQLMFISQKRMKNNFRSSPERIKVALGLDWNDKKYCDKNVIPKISSMKYLKSLPPNTAGGHLAEFFKEWTFNDLYKDRFEKDNVEKDMLSDDRTNDLRNNVGRHMMLTHDLHHILFKYDTSPFGEALIQGTTWRQVGNIGMWYVGFLVTCRIAWRAKSLEPFFIYREACKIAKKVNENNLIEHSLLYFLEKDVDDIRKEFGFEEPVRYLKWINQQEE